MLSVLNVARMYQCAKLKAIPDNRFQDNRKPSIWPVPLSQIAIKLGKLKERDPNLNRSEIGQNTSACSIWGQSFHTFSR